MLLYKLKQGIFHFFINNCGAGVTAASPRRTGSQRGGRQPGGMFANCGCAGYNGARMRKAMACACAKQWHAHGSCKWGNQGNRVRMRKAIVCAYAKQLVAHAQDKE